MAEKKSSSTDGAAGQTGQTQDSGSGEDQVQAAFDEANEKGYFGEVPDETPNENYTLQGVASGKPTPETERTK